MTFVLRWIVTTIAVSIGVFLIPGITLPSDQDAYISIMIFSMFLALCNMGIKPILSFFSLPITILTFGLFSLVLNTAMVYLAAMLASALFLIDIHISGFFTALIFGIVVSVISALINLFMGIEDDK